MLSLADALLEADSLTDVLSDSDVLSLADALLDADSLTDVLSDSDVLSLADALLEADSDTDLLSSSVLSLKLTAVSLFSLFAEVLFTIVCDSLPAKPASLFACRSPETFPKFSAA